MCLIVEFVKEYTPHNMETIQVVLDSKLRRAADSAAKRSGVNRSALIRDALREHLKRLRIRELEERERRGYARYPDTGKLAADWQEVTSWPED